MIQTSDVVSALICLVCLMALPPLLTFGSVPVFDRIFSSFIDFFFVSLNSQAEEKRQHTSKSNQMATIPEWIRNEVSFWATLRRKCKRINYALTPMKMTKRNFCVSFYFAITENRCRLRPSGINRQNIIWFSEISPRFVQRANFHISYFHLFLVDLILLWPFSIKSNHCKYSILLVQTSETIKCQKKGEKKIE